MPIFTHSGLWWWMGYCTQHGRRLQTAFSEGLWELSHNLAVNQAGRRWGTAECSNKRTREAPHTTTVISSQLICKITASFTSAVNKDLTPGIASDWGAVLTKLWMLSKTVTLDFSPLCSENIQTWCLKHFGAWQKLECASKGQISEISVWNWYLIIKSHVCMRAHKYGWLQAEMNGSAFEILILRDLISKHCWVVFFPQSS